MVLDGGGGFFGFCGETAKYENENLGFIIWSFRIVKNANKLYIET